MPLIGTRGAASSRGFGRFAGGGIEAALASKIYPSTVIGVPSLLSSSYQSSGTNWRAYTTKYDGRFINEWDILSNNNVAGANGKSPGNLSSNLGRTVPTTWSALRANSDRSGDSEIQAERPGFGLFVVGRDCPDSVTTIYVAAYGGAGSSTGLSNYASGAFSVTLGDAFRVCVGGGGVTGDGRGGDGVGAGSTDGDANNNRNGGGASGVWYVGIEHNVVPTNRILIAGGGGNNNNALSGVASSTYSREGDTLYGPTYGLNPYTSGGSHHCGGGPGAGGSNDVGTKGGDYNTGTGFSVRPYGILSYGENCFGGGTGGDGAPTANRPYSGAGGFAYNGVGIGGGAGQFGGGGGWQGGGGGWGDTGSAGTSRVLNSISNTNTGVAPGSGIGGVSLSSLGFPYTGEWNRSHPNNRADGFVVIWW